MSASMNSLRNLLGLLVLATVLGACSTPRPPSPPGSVATPGATRPDAPPPAAGGRRSGGYYMDDGPGENPPPDLASVPDAQPRAEALHPRANRPYVVFGREYSPMTEIRQYRERGMASWYGRKFHGQRTSNGEVYDMYGMTAAHPTLPLPSFARVTNVRTGKSVVVRVNDRGPFLNGRVIDLSYTAASRLGYVQSGSTEVDVELITSFGVPPAVQVAQAGTQANPPAVGRAAPSTPGAVVVPQAAVQQVAQQTNQPGTQQASPQSAAPAGVQVGGPIGAPGGMQAGAAGSAAAPGAESPFRAAPAEERLGVETVIKGDEKRPEPPRVEPPRVEPPRTDVPRAEPPRMDSPRVEDARNEPASAGAGNVYLQLGAFGSRDNAEAARARLSRQFDWLANRLEINQEGAMYKVQAGPYRERADALVAAERIRAATDFRPFPTTR